MRVAPPLHLGQRALGDQLPLAALVTHPYAWLFFIPFIIGTTFTVLNLFIGVIVSAMQREHEKAVAAELEAERELLEEETEPLMRRILELKAEVAALRQDLARPAGEGGR